MTFPFLSSYSTPEHFPKYDGVGIRTRRFTSKPLIQSNGYTTPGIVEEVLHYGDRIKPYEVPLPGMNNDIRGIQNTKMKQHLYNRRTLLVIQCFTGGIRKYSGSMKKVVLGEAEDTTLFDSFSWNSYDR